MPPNTPPETPDQPFVKPFPLPEGSIEELLHDVEIVDGKLTNGPCTVTLYKNLKHARLVPFSQSPSPESEEPLNKLPTAFAPLPRGEKFAFLVQADAALQGRMGDREDSLSLEIGLLARDENDYPLFITQRDHEFDEEIATFRNAGNNRCVIVNHRILRQPSRILGPDGNPTQDFQAEEPLIFHRWRDEGAMADAPLTQQFLFIVLQHAKIKTKGLPRERSQVRTRASRLLSGNPAGLPETPPILITETQPIAAFHATLVEEAPAEPEEES